MSLLAENRYGKSRVRLVKVKRHGHWHDVREWTVEILLEGDFESCYVDGDNSGILPTDTMKNTVYSLARRSSAECMEEFGQELIGFFLQRNLQVSAASVELSEKKWDHLQNQGGAHPTAFLQSSRELQFARIAAARNRELSVRSGLEDLVVLKTAGSEFVGFMKDSLTTLPEATDRLFGTAVRAQWTYTSSAVPFAVLRSAIRSSLLKTFAEHQSKSVQHTLYAMGEVALASVPEISEIEIAMPNKHCLLVDLSRFGQDNPNEIFVPTDEPHGTIEARLRRQG
jgi:urate oxidase